MRTIGSLETEFDTGGLHHAACWDYLRGAMSVLATSSVHGWSNGLPYPSCKEYVVEVSNILVDTTSPKFDCRMRNNVIDFWFALSSLLTDISVLAIFD
jgi:hypothetical protein